MPDCHIARKIHVFSMPDGHIARKIHVIYMPDCHIGRKITMHSKLFQDKQKERKHCKYAYKHAIPCT